MNLCILGNSHTGALKRAWDNYFEEESKTQLNIDFYAARRAALESLKLEGNSLIPTNETVRKSISFTSNGNESVNLNDYDSFLIYGLGIKPYYTRENFHSSEVLFCSMRDNYSDSLGFQLASKIRAASDHKIYLGHTPLASNVKKDAIEEKAILSGQYLDGLKLVNEEFLNPLNFELAQQPLETMVNNNRNTHSDFSKGSKRLSVGDKLDDQTHPEGENGHMNDQYGRVWLASFLTKLQKDNS